MFKEIREEVRLIRERDPAARSFWEVFLLYPGFKAVRMYRRAHKHFIKGHFFRARWISERCRRKTGIEIHPGAKIGKGLLIDHGSGVVIGETTEIGDFCTIYQGVTLGGTGKQGGKRHPTLGNHVMVGSGARVLGPFRVGDHAKIAAGAVVLSEVPDHGTAVGVPARVVKVRGVPQKQDNGTPCGGAMDQVHIPDPLAQELCKLLRRIDALEKQQGIPVPQDGETTGTESAT